MNSRLRAAAVATVLAATGAAGAQDAAPTPQDVKAAGDEFDQGRKAFTSKDYAQAAEHFENADRHAPSEKPLELAIRSRDKAGQLDRAATLAALAASRGYKDDNLKKLIAGILKRADKDLGKVTVHCDTPCDVVVGTKLMPGHASTEKTIYVDPGEYTLRAGWSGGRDASGQVKLAKGASSSLDFKEPPEPKVAATATATPEGTPPPPPVASAAPPPGHDQGVVVQPSGWSPAVFWIGAGLTAVAGGVTIWSGVDTQKHPGPDAVRTACSTGSPDCDTLYQQGRDRQTRTNILAGVTAGLGVVTILVGAFATDWSSADAPAKPKKSASRIEPWLGLDNGATLGAAGRF